MGSSQKTYHDKLIDRKNFRSHKKSSKSIDSNVSTTGNFIVIIKCPKWAIYSCTSCHNKYFKNITNEYL